MSVVAVVAPWLLWGLLDSGVYVALSAMNPTVFPPGLAATTTWALVMLLVLRILFSFLAGFLAGKLAKEKKKLVTMAIGLLLATGLLVQIMGWEYYPVWYHGLFLLSIVPAALAGANLTPAKREVA